MTDDLKLTFGKNMKKYRSLNNETSKELAEIIEVSQSTISDWENGKKMPRAGAIESLASHWRINKSQLLLSQEAQIETTFNKISNYNFFDAGLSAGVLNDVDPFTANDVETIGLSDVIMGKYAGDKDIFITYINGESMNRIIPDGSLIAVKQYTDFSELCDGDIVVFQEGAGMAVKRFYNDIKNKIVTFTPDSTSGEFRPINYLYDSMSDVRIIGKVVVYTVTV